MKHVSPGPVLFLSHKANRSGAPAVLLGIVQEFKKNSSLPVSVLLMEEGPLVAEFRKFATTYVWAPVSVRIPLLSGKNPLSSFFSRLFTIFNGLWILWKIRKTKLVFSNTITNGHIHRKLLFLKTKFITYVHELEISIHALTNATTLNTVLNHTDFFLACSEAVKNNLVRNHSVDPEKIDVLYGSIQNTKRQKKDFEEVLPPIRAELNINTDAVIFGSVGENEWRKGFDLFAPLVQLYFRLYPDSRAHFIWMGVRQERMSYFDDLHDFEKYKLHDRAHLILHTTDYLRNMSLFDVHVLLSREDPFPLVVLDAASFSIPTVCFTQAGGAVELISTDAGISVPYGDLYSLAKALRFLETNISERNNLGSTACKKIQTGFNQTEAARRVSTLIENLTGFRSTYSNKNGGK